MAGVCSPQLLPLPYDTSSASGAPLLPFSFEELALERGLRSVTVFDDKLVSRGEPRGSDDSVHLLKRAC